MHALPVFYMNEYCRYITVFCKYGATISMSKSLNCFYYDRTGIRFCYVLVLNSLFI